MFFFSVLIVFMLVKKQVSLTFASEERENEKERSKYSCCVDERQHEERATNKSTCHLIEK